MNTALPAYIEDYKAYVSGLPLPKEVINILAEVETIDKNPLFYLEYASLFENSFPFNDSSNIVKQLNIAGFLCYKYSLLLDSLLDNKSKSMTLSISNIYLEETIKILTNLFGLDNTFWLRWNKRKKEFYEASKLGKSLYEKQNVSFDEYATLCDCKSAMGKVAIDSLDILSNFNYSTVYTKLIESHKLFSIGFQINDDIEDFIEDFKNNDFNIAYYTFSRKSLDLLNNINDANKLLYIDGTAGELYNLSISYFSKALNIAKELNETKWIETISEKIRETKSAKNAIEEYLTILKTRVQIKENSIKVNYFDYTFNVNLPIEKGLHYLVKEWEIDLPEIKHIMVLSNHDGFSNENTIHITDIFQRGILANNFIEISGNYKIDLSTIITEEINYLIGNRNKDEIGGWSYFPSVREIAADADDLGQVMQVLIKGNKRSSIETYCRIPIEILLNDCHHPNTGGIETWILPKHSRSEIQNVQAEFNSTKWGSGPDVDVMANFLYALSLYDYDLYKNYIEEGINYIVSKSEKMSFWNSRWYYGRFYGTMVCVRLCIEAIKNNFNLNEKYSETLQSVNKYILDNQNKDGGWSMEENEISDALNTSFALYTLMISEFSTDILPVLERGIDYLNQTQNKDGSWNAVPFIKPRLNDPYKSKTITTGYVLNTLAIYHARIIAQ
jgi:hypothetical protein